MGLLDKKKKSVDSNESDSGPKFKPNPVLHEDIIKNKEVEDNDDIFSDSYIELNETDVIVEDTKNVEEVIEKEDSLLLDDVDMIKKPVKPSNKDCILDFVHQAKTVPKIAAVSVGVLCGILFLGLSAQSFFKYNKMMEDVKTMGELNKKNTYTQDKKKNRISNYVPLIDIIAETISSEGSIKVVKSSNEYLEFKIKPNNSEALIRLKGFFPEGVVVNDYLLTKLSVTEIGRINPVTAKKAIQKQISTATQGKMSSAVLDIFKK